MHTSPIRIAVNGACGRTGSCVCRAVEADPRFALAARYTSSERAGGSDPTRLDAVIDFSTDEGARDAVALADRAGAALLVATTDLSAQTLDAIEDVARRRAVVVAANTSLGIAVLSRLAALATRDLGAGFDIHVVERHHVHKRDAPSGTALALARAIAAAGRPIDPAGIISIRSGEIPGEHTIEFGGPGERLTLTHTAGGRELFAAGALRAAAWLVDQPAGRYGIDAAFGLSTDAAAAPDRDQDQDQG